MTDAIGRLVPSGDEPAAIHAPASDGYDPELLRRWVDVQQQEAEQKNATLELRREELALQRLQIEHANTYSMRLLEEQAKAATDVRARGGTAAKWDGLWKVTILSAIVLVIILAMALNKDAFLEKLIQFGIVAVGSGAFGYTVGRNATPKDQPSQPGD